MGSGWALGLVWPWVLGSGVGCGLGPGACGAGLALGSGWAEVLRGVWNQLARSCSTGGFCPESSLGKLRWSSSPTAEWRPAVFSGPFL